MKIVKRLFGTVEAEESDEKPCNVSGHNWGGEEVSGYYTSGVPHFGRGDSWRVKRQYRQECMKCGKVRYEKDRIGKISVDKTTDELTIVSNETRDDQ